MVEKTAKDVEHGADESDLRRIYEVGYTIVPTVKEEDLDKVVGSIRSEIEKMGGAFIAEGAPSSIKLSYPMSLPVGGKKTEFDRAYFGWIKFESDTSVAQVLENALKQNVDVLRSIVFRTVREDTRAKMKAPTLREVRRTDTIKAAPRVAPTIGEKTVVSEEDLEKALKDITTE